MPYTVPAGQSIQTALQKNDNLLLISGAEYPGNFNLPRNNLSFGVTDPTKPMPIVHGGILEAYGRANISIDGIKFDGHTGTGPGSMDQFGAKFVCCTNVRINKTKWVNFGGLGISFEGVASKRASTFALTNSYIGDNWPLGAGHVQGFYAQYADGIILKGDTFYHNGGKPGDETVFNHGVYFYATCGQATVTENVFSMNCSHGLQQRCGGYCGYNIFVDNAVHQSYGLVNGSTVKRGGVAGIIEKNIYVGGKNIDLNSNNKPDSGEYRGWCLELSQIGASGVVAQDLLMVQDNQKFSSPLHVAVCGGKIDNPADMISPSKFNLKLQRIFVDKSWAKPPLDIVSGARVTKGDSCGVLPPILADARAVLGTDYIEKCKNDPAQIKQYVLKTFSAYGLTV